MLISIPKFLRLPIHNTQFICWMPFIPNPNSKHQIAQFSWKRNTISTDKQLWDFYVNLKKRIFCVSCNPAVAEELQLFVFPGWSIWRKGIKFYENFVECRDATKDFVERISIFGLHKIFCSAWRRNKIFEPRNTPKPWTKNILFQYIQCIPWLI